MNNNPSPQEIYRKIQDGSEAWRDLIPAGQLKWFVEGVQEAIAVYLSLIDPKDLKAELEALERATRSDTVPIYQIVSDLSPEASEALSISGPLPSKPRNTLEEKQYCDDIRSRVISAQRWRTEGDKRRWVTKAIGPPKKMGRPSDKKIDVLVGLVCAAYAGAVGELTSRSWSEAGESGIERIVGDCFANLGIDHRHSAKKAVQRHIENRRD